MYWREVLKRSSGQHKCYKDRCFAVVLYSICYSIIFPCTYWNSNTLDAIIENGFQLNNTMQSKCCLTSVTLPHSVKIFGTNINVRVNEVSHGELSNSNESSICLETLILRNHTGKTDFLMWISSYCIACINLLTNAKEKAIIFSSDIWRQSFTYNETEKNTLVVWII